MLIADINDIVGQVFTRLTVLLHSHYDRSRKMHFYQVKCECGTIKEVGRNNLLRGTTKSCGCLSREMALETLRKHRENGLSSGPRKDYKSNLPDLTLRDVELSYMIYRSDIYPVATCPAQIFRQAIVTTLAKVRMRDDEIFSVLRDPDFDIHSKWWILLCMIERDRPLTIYESYSLAEQALKEKGDKAS